MRSDGMGGLGNHREKEKTSAAFVSVEWRTSAGAGFGQTHHNLLHQKLANARPLNSPRSQKSKLFWDSYKSEPLYEQTHHLKKNSERKSFVQFNASKKGQMEIMGLVIVVVLIAFGILFAMKYLFGNDDEDLRQMYSDAQMAANFLNTLVGVTTACHGATITDLIQDCALTASIVCPQGNSCDEVEHAVSTILADTLDVWNKNYYFHIEGPTRVAGISYGAECPGMQESKRHPIPLGAGVGSVDLIMDICQ